jgi:hypothetical protein
MAEVLGPRHLDQQHTDRGAADPGGPSFRIFQVSVFRRIQDLLPHPLFIHAFPDSAFLRGPDQS